MSKLKMREIGRAEVRVNCYAGPNFDDHEKWWCAFFEGDMQEGEGPDPLELTTKNFPPGTVVRIECPVCPECDMVQDICDCGFDWKGWASDQYS